MKLRTNLQRQRRHVDRQLDSPRDDPYQPKLKAGAASCPKCGAVYRRGRWRWEATAALPPRLCPACKRAKDGLPAGLVRISGAFFAAHRDEVLALLKKEEERERKDHPLQRILSITPGTAAARITTADVHIARRLGDALQRAFRGALHTRYSQDEHLVRVSWKRD